MEWECHGMTVDVRECVEGEEECVEVEEGLAEEEEECFRVVGCPLGEGKSIHTILL